MERKRQRGKARRKDGEASAWLGFARRVVAAHHLVARRRRPALRTTGALPLSWRGDKAAATSTTSMASFIPATSLVVHLPSSSPLCPSLSFGSRLAQRRPHPPSQPRHKGPTSSLTRPSDYSSDPQHEHDAESYDMHHMARADSRTRLEPAPDSECDDGGDEGAQRPRKGRYRASGLGLEASRVPCATAQLPAPTSTPTSQSVLTTPAGYSLPPGAGAAGMAPPPQQFQVLPSQPLQHAAYPPTSAPISSTPPPPRPARPAVAPTNGFTTVPLNDMNPLRSGANSPSQGHGSSASRSRNPSKLGFLPLGAGSSSTLDHSPDDPEKRAGRAGHPGGNGRRSPSWDRLGNGDAERAEWENFNPANSKVQRLRFAEGDAGKTKVSGDEWRSLEPRAPPPLPQPKLTPPVLPPLSLAP